MLPTIDRNVADLKTTRYRRTHNTPVRETENRLNQLYGAWRTILCSTGMEAVNTVLDIIQPLTVIVDDQTYFETRHYISYQGYHMIQMENMNDLDILKNILESLAPRVLLILDSPTTFGTWKQIRDISCLAHEYGAYVMADNSIVSLYYSNPIEEGADICVESYTKYVCGYGDTFAGGIALAPSMKWLEDVPIPCTCPGMNSLDWILSRRGNYVTPDTAYMVSRGLETLPVRMERHTQSARYISTTLKEVGVEECWSGRGGLITLPGKGEEFCKKLKRFVAAGTFGCTWSNSDFFRNDTCYKEGVCARLSVGLENPDELILDVEQALGIPLQKTYENVKEEFQCHGL